MAKVPFTKLKCKINEDTVPVQIGEETIAVKQYLPIQEKLRIIGEVVMLSHEQDYNYSNPVKIGLYRDLEIIMAYTNLTFTDKQREDSAKLYDLLVSSGILQTIISNIPKEEYDYLCAGVKESVESIYKYQNSILGILDTISSDYEKTSLDLQSLIKDVNNPEQFAFLNQVLTKLG
jgi:hypothetical protein